ncbi:DUF192 domain-containing protein [Streptomyces sp. NPDC050560]|uniref:DUF192 domain-containing protein n=1 Tax=Streptomyces sp. NPDC050560 TaxID=3365630 RepID=UPI0037AD2173
MGRWRNGQGRLVVDPSEDEGARGADGADTADGAREARRAAPSGIPLEIATSYRARTRGLLGRDGIEGAILLSPASSVHTFRMRFAIDVAYLNSRMKVVSLHTMKPGRLGTPRLRARHVLEAEAGAMASWGIRRGTRVRVEQ